MARLSDTEALVRQGINPPGVVVAPLNGGSGIGEGRDTGADNIRPGQGKSQWSSGAGDESLSCAVNVCKE